MKKQGQATILMFGSLFTFRQQRGLSPSIELPLSAAGKPARDIAMDLGLPVNSIGAIYCNHRPASLNRLIQPGDRVAFVPLSVPGPHNSPLGLPIVHDEVVFQKAAQG